MQKPSSDANGEPVNWVPDAGQDCRSQRGCQALKGPQRHQSMEDLVNDEQGNRMAVLADVS